MKKTEKKRLNKFRINGTKQYRNTGKTQKQKYKHKKAEYVCRN